MPPPSVAWGGWPDRPPGPLRVAHGRRAPHARRPAPRLAGRPALPVAPRATRSRHSCPSRLGPARLASGVPVVRSSCARPADQGRALCSGCPRRRGSNHPGRSGGGGQRLAEEAVAAAVERLLDLALVVGVDRRAARRRRGRRAGARPRAGRRPRWPAAVLTRPTRRPTRCTPCSPSSVLAARALLEHVDESGGEATTGSARHTVLPEDASLAGRGAAVTPAALATVRRPGVGAGRGERGPARWAHHAASGSTWCRRSRRPSARRRWSSGPRPARRSRWSAGVELLLDHWGAHPPSELRAGGLGVRELKAAAVHLHVDEPTAALLVEVAAEARLLASRFDDDGNAVYAPTDDFDAWTRLRRPNGGRGSPGPGWGTSRLPGLVGMRDVAGRAHDRAGAREHQRRSPWRPAGSSSPRSPLFRRVRCSRPAPGRPRWSSGSRGCVPDVPARAPTRWCGPCDEATALGLVALGGVPAYARALLAGDDAAPLLTPLLPEPVDHVLRPGGPHRRRPRPARAGPGAPAAGRGGGGVARRGHGVPLHGPSVRRALDLGWTAAELHDVRRRRSRAHRSPSR